MMQIFFQYPFCGMIKGIFSCVPGAGQVFSLSQCGIKMVLSLLTFLQIHDFVLFRFFNFISESEFDRMTNCFYYASTAATLLSPIISVSNKMSHSATLLSVRVIA